MTKCIFWILWAWRSWTPNFRGRCYHGSSEKLFIGKMGIFLSALLFYNLVKKFLDLQILHRSSFVSNIPTRAEPRVIKLSIKDDQIEFQELNAGEKPSQPRKVENSFHSDGYKIKGNVCFAINSDSTLFFGAFNFLSEINEFEIEIDRQTLKDVYHPAHDPNSFAFVTREASSTPCS